MRNRKKKSGLLERVGSSFENGYGNEGRVAKLISGALIGGIVVFSVALGLVMVLTAPFRWVKNALFGREASK